MHGVSDLKTDAGASLEDTDVEQTVEIVSEIIAEVPRRTMGRTELLLLLLLGLLWFRSALLCAGEEQQCLYAAVMFTLKSVHTSVLIHAVFCVYLIACKIFKL